MYIRPIINKADLRDAYEWLLELQQLEGRCSNEQARRDYEVAYKNAIRNYHRSKGSHANYQYIKDYGIDGGIYLIRVPENIRTDWGARQWFMENEYREYQPSPYDCTGQISTSWWKLIKRDGRFYIYHSVSVDL